MTRPSDLPDFDSPPLTEVVVGIQYEPMSKFGVVDLGDIHKLFSNEFPRVEEQAPLHPRIETFGGTSSSATIQFEFGPAFMAPRLWFVSPDDDHLLQFQDDRFMLNWRKRGQGDTYPRFEGVLAVFEENLERLSKYYSNRDHQLKVAQVEVTYINVIPVGSFNELSNWLNIIFFSEGLISSTAFQAEEVLEDEQGRPHSRFFVELNSVFTRDGKEKAFRLNLTVRGRPSPDSNIGFRDYILLCRHKIVTTFDRLITEKAQKEWEKR